MPLDHGKKLSLFRLNHRLPGCEAHPEVVQGTTVPSHIPHPSDGDPRHFLAAFFARTTNPPSGMVSSHERRYTKHLRPWRVVWVSCSRLSKRPKSNICPL